MNTIAGSIPQLVALAPSVSEQQPPARRRRAGDVVALAEQALFSAGILGAAVLAGSFFWQILQ